MKKLILLIAAVSIAAVANAQRGTELRSRLLFGLKIGTNYSNVYDSDGENFNSNPKVGLVTGGYLAIPIGKFLGVQPEVLFSQRGFYATGVVMGGDYNLTRTTNNVDVPVYFAFKPTRFITFLAGPQFSYLTSQRDVFANGSTTIERQQVFESANIRRNTLCFATGADLNIRHLVLGARLGWAVQNNNGDGSVTVPRYKDVWFQTTVGYRFYRK